MYRSCFDFTLQQLNDSDLNVNLQLGLRKALHRNYIHIRREVQYLFKLRFFSPPPQQRTAELIDKWWLTVILKKPPKDLTEAKKHNTEPIPWTQHSSNKETIPRAGNSWKSMSNCQWCHGLQRLHTSIMNRPYIHNHSHLSALAGRAGFRRQCGISLAPSVWMLKDTL